MQVAMSRVGISRVAMLRACAAVAVAATSVAAGSTAHAKPGFAVVSLSPAAFVSNCQSLGGTSSPAPNGGIRCTLASGQTVDCSFDTSAGTALCQWTKDLPPKGKKQLIGDPLPNSVSPNTTPPKATGAPDAPSTVN